MKRPRLPLRVGDHLRFRRVIDIARYGPTATIVGRGIAVDQPHPGFIHHLLIDLESADGTQIQWPVSQVRARLEAA